MREADVGSQSADTIKLSFRSPTAMPPSTKSKGDAKKNDFCHRSPLRCRDDRMAIAQGFLIRTVAAR
jgi:hypothetical protein